MIFMLLENQYVTSF